MNTQLQKTELSYELLQISADIAQKEFYPSVGDYLAELIRADCRRRAASLREQIKGQSNNAVVTGLLRDLEMLKGAG